MILILNLFAVFIIYIVKLNCQEIKSDNTLVVLDNIYNGTLDMDNSYHFYRIIIPNENDMIIENKDLVFRVKELDLADSGKEDFSDPDIYISRNKTFPKNLLEADYYSERFGEDLISISNKDIYPGLVLYFSIYCQFKCNYQFYAILEPEIKIKENELYSFSIKDGNSFIIKFDQLRNNAREIEFISYSPKLSNYRMFVSFNKSPSSENSLPIIPSWIGGYYSSINSDSILFCSNCTYYILLESEKGSAEIFFMIKYEDSVNRIKTNEPIFSTLKPYNMHCYSININEENKNKTLIIQTMLFSGSTTLLINPWINPRGVNETSIRSGLFYNFKYQNHISSEYLKMISPKDRKEGIIETGNLYICLRSFEYTSYLLKVYFSDKIQRNQKFNLLYNGVTMNGFLPSNSTTKYRAVEFSRDADVFFDLQVFSGNVKIYGYICEDYTKCFFDNVKFEKIKKDTIEAEKTPNGYRVTIPDIINTCHKKLEKEDTEENEIASLPCAILSIIRCEGTEACSYNILTTHTNSTVKLSERKPHYQIVSYNDTDTYKINIDDNSISNVTIILNSNSGDADLFVTGLNNDFDSRSLNEGYIPDVIRIEKSDTLPDLKGEYLVIVWGKTFASYSIYYYTHKLNEISLLKDSTENLKNNNTQIIHLETGKIIKGYIKEEKGKINYAVYSYRPNLLEDSEALDIRITLTPEHSEYQMYVVLDKNKITFERYQYTINLKDYIWRSSLNNEIIIKKTDPNYKKDIEYFIVIVPKLSNIFYSEKSDINQINSFNSTNSTNTTDQIHSFFFLGVTLKDVPFVIQEGIPSLISLDSDYHSQNYWYYHYNISNPLMISLNVFYGRVDIYIDLFWSRNISESKTAIKALDTDSNFITISREKLINLLYRDSNNEKDLTNTIIPLYILIKKSSILDAQYLLVIKSHESKPEKLQPSVVRSELLLSGEYKNYFLYLRKNDTGILNVIFKNGYGDLYMNIYSSDDFTNTNNYPNIIDYLFKASDYYKGKTLEISDELLNKCSASCKILISVHGNNLGYSEDKIEYSLGYYKDAVKINQNQPFHNQIQEGELQFFRVYFGENTKNIYLSLSNMNGDADIYVNYGLNLPSYEKADWSSYTSRSEFIEFDINDNFFVSNKIQTLSGDYTIMISGFKKTSYSLYITTHPKKIVPLNDNSPASCITKNDGEYCYFRYDDVYEYDTIINDSYNNYISDNNNNTNISNDNNSLDKILNGKSLLDKDFDIVILTHFIYSAGNIYAKLYDDTDYDILEDFPDDNNYDFSNVNSNKRNLLFLSIKKDNPKYNTNSTILISVKCAYKCFFDLTATKQYQSTIKYLNNEKDNIFYLSKSTSPLLFIYLNDKHRDIYYQLKAIKGKAFVSHYRNEILSDQYNNTIDSEGFVSDSESRTNADIHGLIKNNNFTIFENVYFKIIPETDFAFELKLTHKYDWREIKTGKMEVFPIDVKNKRFYGYLTMHSEFDNVILSISANDKNLTAYCYMKYVAYNKAHLLNTTSKSYLQNNIITEVLPNELDNDYKANNLNLYHLIKLKLPRLDFNKIEDKIVTIFFSVALFDTSPNKDISDIKLNVHAAPQVNNITITSIPQNSFQFVSIEGFDSKSSVFIYDLKRQNENEKILTVEISSCLGAVDVLVSKSIINNKDDAIKNSLMPYTLENSNGRDIYMFKDINVDDLYLVIYAKQVISQDCKLIFGESKLKCDKEQSEVLLKYYFSNEHSIYSIPRVIEHGMSLEYDVKNSKTVTVKWHSLSEIYLLEETYESNVFYEVYVSESIKDYMYMDSICYLDLLAKDKSNKIDLGIIINKNNHSAEISKIKPGKKYFVNILATKIDTRDVIAYKTIEIITQEDLYPPILIGGVALALVVLIIMVIYFYRKYIYTKKVLNYEINDVRNVGSSSQISEMRDVSVVISSRRYENIVEDINTSATQSKI